MQTTPSLAEIQSWLSARILSDPAVPESRTIDRWITPAPGAEERLGIYINGYPARLEEALCEAFPTIAHIIGAKEMCALVRRFAAVARLRSYNLNDAGADLPRLLRSDPLSERFPFLPDLAELEWRVLRAFHAGGDGRFDPSSVARWDDDAWSRAAVQFQPWLAIVSSDWPIHEIWELRETPVEEIDIELNDKPAHVLVHRHELSVTCEAVDTAQAQALHLLIGGLPLGMAMETLNARGVAAESIGEWFQRWVELGLIRSVALSRK